MSKQFLQFPFMQLKIPQLVLPVSKRNLYNAFFVELQTEDFKVRNQLFPPAQKFSLPQLAGSLQISQQSALVSQSLQNVYEAEDIQTFRLPEPVAVELKKELTIAVFAASFDFKQQSQLIQLCSFQLQVNDLQPFIPVLAAKKAEFQINQDYLTLIDTVNKALQIKTTFGAETMRMKPLADNLSSFYYAGYYQDQKYNYPDPRQSEYYKYLQKQFQYRGERVAAVELDQDVCMLKLSYQVQKTPLLDLVHCDFVKMLVRAAQLNNILALVIPQSQNAEQLEKFELSSQDVRLQSVSF